MEQLHFDTNIYANSADYYHYSQPQLQPAFQYQDDSVYAYNNINHEVVPVDLDANQEFLNLMFLQNQIIQSQHFNNENALITPTDEMFGNLGIESVEPVWLNNTADSSQAANGMNVSPLPLPPTVDSYFEIKSPFLINQSVQQSNLLKTRSVSETQHRTLNEVAGNTISRSKSTLSSSNPFYAPNEYIKRMTSPLKIEIANSPRVDSRKVSKKSLSHKTSPKINNNFIREYNNKKISKFIKGTKKTNKGYKNFINYKCTGDNFERD